MVVAHRAVASSIGHLWYSLPTVVRKQSMSWNWFTKPLLPILIPAVAISLPGLISDIWDGLLNAVPKKKTSYMKKRHRQLAGKALKDVNAVNNCPGCGKPKKAHTLCPYCVAEIQQAWKQAAKNTNSVGASAKDVPQ